MICRFEAAPSGQQYGAARFVNEILLVGGGSRSPHLYKRLRQTYEQFLTKAAKYPIPVRRPNDPSTGTSTCIALGALVLLADEAVVQERVLRRGHCVAVNAPCGRNSPGAWFDESDGWWDHQIALCMLRPGDGLPINHRLQLSKGQKGYFRKLADSEMTRQGWALEEHLYSFEDATIQDGTPIWDERIHECGTALCFWLSREDAAAFETRHDPGGPYRHCEYDVEIVIRGNDMLYELIIPRSGKFSSNGDYGPNPIRRQGELKIDVGFGLANTVG